MLIWHLITQPYFVPTVGQAPCWAVKTKQQSKLCLLPHPKQVGETDIN